MKLVCAGSKNESKAVLAEVLVGLMGKEVGQEPDGLGPNKTTKESDLFSRGSGKLQRASR